MPSTRRGNNLMVSADMPLHQRRIYHSMHHCFTDPQSSHSRTPTRTIEYKSHEQVPDSFYVLTSSHLYPPESICQWVTRGTRSAIPSGMDWRILWEVRIWKVKVVLQMLLFLQCNGVEDICRPCLHVERELNYGC
jgi:hypothetical protein